MNYFTHNIGDFAIATQYLTDEELGIYVRLRDHYLSTEKPLQCEWIAIAMRTHCKESVDNVLSLLFTKGDGFWFSESLDEIIGAYQEKAEKASKSAQSRWKKSKVDANAMQSQCERNANAFENDANAMLTNNQEPITNNQEIKKNNKKKTASLVKPDDVSQEVFDEWIDFKKSVSRAKPSQRMIDAIVREAQAAEITTEKAMVLQMENGWQGFKAEYVRKESGNLFGQQSNEVTAKTITDNQVRLFASTLANFGPMSKFSRSGESYKQFEMRLATNLRIPERFEEYKPYLIKVGLLEN